MTLNIQTVVLVEQGRRGVGRGVRDSFGGGRHTGEQCVRASGHSDHSWGFCFISGKSKGFRVNWR